MRWIGNKYVDAEGHVVALVFIETQSHTAGLFVGCGVTGIQTEFIGGYIAESDAMRAVERWWNERQVESLRLEEKA